MRCVCKQVLPTCPSVAMLHSQPQYLCLSKVLLSLHMHVHMTTSGQRQQQQHLLFSPLLWQS